MGMTMMASAAAPAMEYVFVNASGIDDLHALPGKIGIKGQGDDQRANEQRGSPLPRRRR